MRRFPILVLLALVLSLLAACGTSGGDDSAGSDAKTTTSAASNEDEDDDTPATPADGDPSDRPTSATLADLLPTAEEVGPGYEMSDEDLGDDADESDDDGDDADGDDAGDDADEDDPTEQAILEACPGADILSELDNSDDDNADEVSREFENEAEASIEVALDPTPDQFNEETVAKVVEALSDCGTITTEDGDGGQIEMELSAEETDEFGDFGLTMTMDATFSIMGMTIPISFRGLIFSVDGTTVSVVATSGLDEATFESVPGDYDLVPELAALMEERVASL